MVKLLVRHLLGIIGIEQTQSTLVSHFLGAWGVAQHYSCFEEAQGPATRHPSLRKLLESEQNRKGLRELEDV